VRGERLEGERHAAWLQLADGVLGGLEQTGSALVTRLEHVARNA
jgi:hypothetical protein